MSSSNAQSLKLHRKYGGKIEIAVKVPLESEEDLSLAYTPGVASVCRAIAEEPSRLRDLTVAGNALAVVTNGTAVLGLGDIGPGAAMPVMEGKAALFKKLVGIDAWPICLRAKEPEPFMEAVRALAPGFSAINLEDIAAPECFEIEDGLQDLGIPVMHDDQHGTAVVVLAALLNAVQVTGKAFPDLRVVISGSGAAGRAIAQLLQCVNGDDSCESVGEVVVCDSEGAIHKKRSKLSDAKKSFLDYTNAENRRGSLSEVLKGADVLVGVSVGDLLEAKDISRMADDPIVMALANPTPEIMPDQAREGGAAVVATGRSDFPNQINNVLGFPGIFRGAVDARAERISPAMKLAAARALAESVPDPRADHILPEALNSRVHETVARAVQEASE